MSYLNYSWEVIAQDYNSPYLRNHLWTNGMFKYAKLMNVSNPKLGIISLDNHIQYIADMDSWKKTSEDLKKKILTDYNFFEELIDKTNAWGEQFITWTENNIFKVDLSELSNQELILLLRKFIDNQEDGYAYGTALPMIDLIKGSFIENNLIEFLKSQVPVDKFPEYYSVFTFPSHNSFAQDQEEDLLRLMSIYYSNENWRSDIQRDSQEIIQKKYLDFFQKLQQHTAKYTWAYYVYMGPGFNEANFLEFIKDYLHKNINPAKKLIELQEKRRRMTELKTKYLVELKPDPFFTFVLRIAGKVVWAKPRRKDYQSKAYYHLEKLLKEITKRLYISLDQVRSLPTDLLTKALNNEKVDLTIANEIKKCHVCLPTNEQTTIDLIKEEAQKFLKKYFQSVKEENIQTNQLELKGASACAGKAKGVVKIINLPTDMKKMEYGNILVSTATTPSIVPAMKKAAAILTDEGGLTCHAAIVSRELNTPCVVGLKIITTSVQDGDEVEVDANDGTIKILKRAK